MNVITKSAVSHREIQNEECKKYLKWTKNKKIN